MKNRYSVFSLFCMLAIFNQSNAQFGGLKNKLKSAATKITTSKLKGDANDNSSSNADTKSYESEEEFNQSTTEQEKSENETSETVKIVDGGVYNIGGTNFKKIAPYKKDFTDRTGLSGYYHLSEYILNAPSNHFSSEPGQIYEGFSIDYNPEKYEMQVYFTETEANYANVAEHYRKSADQGNILFQFGMQGGPTSLTNVKAIPLEPGVILLGANVYHKNDEEGHAWMNNITPERFVIAAKDTAKFKEYQYNVEYTSKVVFEKFDALRRVWKEQKIEEAKPLPAEGMKDAKLKADALAGIKSRAAAYQWKEEILYAYVESTEWDVKLHWITLQPIKRIAKCIVVMKTPTGNFKREGFYVAQDYKGNGTYGNTYMQYNDQRIYYVNPSEVNKYK